MSAAAAPQLIWRSARLESVSLALGELLRFQMKNNLAVDH
jgi:hypothetical protein